MTHRIEFIYVVCKTPEEAHKIMANKRWITNSLRRYNTILSSIPNDLTQAHQYFGEPENVIALIKPPSYLEVVSELPNGPLLQQQLTNVIKVITRLDEHNFTIECDRDPITKENNYNTFFVHLPAKSYVDLVYQSQPFFGSILAHKITHLEVCGFTRFSEETCMVTDQERDESSIWDMSTEASARQVNINTVDPASTELIAQNMTKIKEMTADLAEGETVCIKCPTKIETGIECGLCAECYRIQARQVETPVPDHYNDSFFFRQVSDL